MNTKSSSLHSLVHVMMLIVIIGLLSLHLQLRGRYEELVTSCTVQHRTNRKSSDQTDHCSDGADDNRGCFHRGLSFTSATSPLPLKASSSSSEIVLDKKRTYLETDTTSDDVYKSISISHSLFASTGVPFETSKPVTFDEYGKTDSEGAREELVVFPTESTASIIQLLGTDYLEVTEGETLMRERKSKNSSTFNQAIIDAETLTHSKTIHKDTHYQFKTTVQEIISNPYSASIYVSENERTLLSVGVSEAGSLLPKTSFDSKILEALETDDDITTSAKRQSIFEKGNLDLIHSGTKNSYEKQAEDAVFLTENVSEEFNDDDDETFCDTEDCFVNIHPVRLEEVPYYYYSQSDEDGIYKDVYSKQVEGNGVLLSSLWQKGTSKDLEKLMTLGTSVWCSWQNSRSKLCHAKNLCYKVANQDFIFLKGEKSVVIANSSLNNGDWHEAFSVNLSAVQDHNAYTLPLVTIPAESLARFSSVAILHRKALLMSRFKPDNIMHMLHDDVLPLFHTLQNLNFMESAQKSNIAVVFADSFDDGEFINFYSALSSVLPSPLWKLNKTAEVLCFDDVHIGLSASTLWYQYGFQKPQAPLGNIDSELVANVHKGADYLAEYFSSPCIFCDNRNYLVLLSRKDNRLILNEGELILSIVRSTKLKVMSVSMETHSIQDIISIVRNSKGVIGMHGSLVIFVIFLHPGSIVIELFPYAVNPSRYTPFKTFCDLSASGIVYKSWVNPDRDRSLTHPDWLPEMGGISHLPSDMQKTILGQSEVPEHLCCENPSWLFHIYQDTEVNVEAITSLAVLALTEAQNMQLTTQAKSAGDFPVLPGKVFDLTCKLQNQKSLFTVTWKLPWNLEFIVYSILKSQLVIQEDQSKETFNVDLPSDTLTYAFEPSREKVPYAYNVWVRVTVDHNLNGPYAFILCKHER